MPNIEIWGLRWEDASPLRSKIWEMFSGKPYASEMVVSIVTSNVQNIDYEERPFIRLANSCQEHTQEIIEILQTLEMDIERLVLEEFYPASQNKKEEGNLPITPLEGFKFKLGPQSVGAALVRQVGIMCGQLFAPYRIKSCSIDISNIIEVELEPVPSGGKTVDWPHILKPS